MRLIENVDVVDDNNEDDNENVDNVNDIYIGVVIIDPINWDSLEFKMIELVATKGLERDLTIVNAPKDKSSRLFTTNLSSRRDLTIVKCPKYKRDLPLTSLKKLHFYFIKRSTFTTRVRPSISHVLLIQSFLFSLEFLCNWLPAQYLSMPAYGNDDSEKVKQFLRVIKVMHSKTMK